MAAIKAQGRVVETRPDCLVISVGTGALEETHECDCRDALPGDYVWIFEDGQVEMKNRPVPLREISIPTHVESDSPDHS